MGHKDNFYLFIPFPMKNKNNFFFKFEFLKKYLMPEIQMGRLITYIKINNNSSNNI